MTVKELIERLSEIENKDLPIYVYDNIEIEDGSKAVLAPADLEHVFDCSEPPYWINTPNNAPCVCLLGKV